MLLKTKDDHGMAAGNAWIYLKTNDLFVIRMNLIENKAGYTASVCVGYARAGAKGTK
jgi:hypothetical protein